VVPPLSFGALQLLITVKTTPSITTINIRRSRDERRLKGNPKGIKISARAASALPAPSGQRMLLAEGLAAVWLGAVV
jgi:hypothetical protein